MRELIQAALAKAGDNQEINTFKKISGGDINEAFQVTTSETSYFIKANQQIPRHFFQMEAKGLELIRATETIPTPAVYHYDLPENGGPGVMVMEWIHGTRKDDTGERLGRQLAAMHQSQQDYYGLDGDTFVGTLPQPNGWYEDWPSYYHEQRLLPQMKLADSQGLLHDGRRKRLEQLFTKLDEWLPKQPGASLLHGDLWGGNWMAGPGGQPYLIDPSVLYGDRSFELAFTELFGGFPEDFYEAYNEVYPLPDSYADQKEFYQLFYLLVHLNLFGESYGSSVDRVLQHYIG
ncbi:fructosamine kinase family protein [Thalassobacillus devorans]|uniref:fructosamine kinase family protein n=1 Tax=Thalassobacillus devorans TaxID=279813 RepID=UPI000A1CB40B|nr:fructosamine kinase family protein [Thalassobacillus devorans]